MTPLREKKTIIVKNIETSEEKEEAYDKLILCPGAGAIVPQIEGVWSKNVFHVKTVPDSDKVNSIPFLIPRFVLLLMNTPQRKPLLLVLVLLA